MPCCSALATLCVLGAAVEYDALRDARLALLVLPAAVLLAFFARRELRLTRGRLDPLVDLRLFTRPSYSVGVGLALLYFAGATGLPLVLALYYQRGLGYSALQSGLGITAFAAGSVIAAPLAGRAVTRLGRPLVVAGLLAFAVGAFAVDLAARQAQGQHAALWLAPPAAPGRPRCRSGHHAEPDPVADGRRRPDGQHGRRGAADRAADRLGRGAGGHRRRVLRRPRPAGGQPVSHGSGTRRTAWG